MRDGSVRRRAGRPAPRGGAGVARDRDLGGMVAPDLVGIDVEVDELLARRNPKPWNRRAHRQHHVGGVDHRAHAAVHPHRADRQRVTIVDRALALARGDHRCLQVLGDLGQRVGRVAEHHSAAGDDQRARRRRQHRGRPLERFEIDGRRRRRRSAPAARSRRVSAERLRRDLDLHRPLAPGGHQAERLAHRVGDLGGIEHARGPTW